MSSLIDRLKLLLRPIMWWWRVRNANAAKLEDESKEGESASEPEPVAQVLQRESVGTDGALDAATAKANALAADVIMPMESLPESDAPSEQKPNRKARRARDAKFRLYEKRRLALDKFVTPAGTPPTPISRREQEEKKEPPPKSPPTDHEVNDDGSNFYIGKHPDSRDDDVLYNVNEILGQFNFRDTILDQIERYFVYLDRMRKHDFQSYEFYRHVGAQLIPYSSTPEIDIDLDDKWGETDKYYKTLPMMTSSFMARKPSFGCCAYGTSPVVEKIEVKKKMLLPKFMYFTKFACDGAPWEIQRISRNAGDIYRLTVWWDHVEKNKSKYGSPEQYPLLVQPDGGIRLLRMLTTERLKILSKRHGISRISRREWRIPHHGDDWAKQHHTDASRFIGHIFADAAMRLEHSAYGMLRISVRNSYEQHALFSLDPRRMGYFFQDRDYQLTPEGRRKRIFHMVRPHVDRNGVARKLHFRGEREFTWAGYKVRITVPGKDHPMIEEHSHGVYDEASMACDHSWVLEEEFGRTIRARIDGHSISEGEIKTVTPRVGGKEIE